MTKSKLLYLLGIILLFAALIALNYNSPKPVNWNETYNVKGKEPYGCFILNDMFPTIFPKQKVNYNNDSFYLSLDSNSVEKENVIVITNNFNPDKLDLDVLLKFVSKGNNLFISSYNFDKHFLEKCKIEIKAPAIDTSSFYRRKDSLFLEAPELKNDSGYHYTRRMPTVYVSAFDTLRTFKLGTNRNGKTNFIVTKYGLGKIYVHTQPLVFTNYHLLYGNADYASGVLSYLPVRKTIWDDYYKPDRFINTSPMRFILSQDSLRTAYYLLLITLLLYFVVESRRRQRVIPIVKPLENHSLQFVKTIGSLYFKQRNNIDILRKKLIYFKEFLRERYSIVNITTSEDCIATICVKSGADPDLVMRLLKSVDHYENTRIINDNELIELNHKMEMFYKQCL